MLVKGGGAMEEGQERAGVTAVTCDTKASVQGRDTFTGMID